MWLKTGSVGRKDDTKQAVRWTGGHKAGDGNRPEEARNRTDRQTSRQADRQRDLQIGVVETVKVGRQERRKKTDRQVGARQLDRQKGNGRDRQGMQSGSKT